MCKRVHKFYLNQDYKPRGFYNEQNNMVNSIYYHTSCVINMNCRKWESGLRTISNSQGKMDAMAIEEWWSM